LKDRCPGGTSHSPAAIDFEQHQGRRQKCINKDFQRQISRAMSPSSSVPVIVNRMSERRRVH
jgi:hypothetical protein